MIIDCALYEDGQRHGGKVDLDEVAAACHRKGAFVWIGLFEPTEEEFATVRREFDLHELAVEDAITAHQRPKLEVYDDTLFLVLKTARYDEPSETVELGEILIFVGDGFIVHVRHGAASALAGVRARIESRPDLLACGPSTPRHRRQGGRRLRAGDGRAGKRHPRGGAPGVRRGRRREPGGADLFPQAGGARDPPGRRSPGGPARSPGPGPDSLPPRGHPRVLPGRPRPPPAGGGAGRHLPGPAHQRPGSEPDPGVGPPERGHAQDLAWVAIAAVPTMVAGVYGMNFEHMPELRSPAGYPIVLTLMAVVCLGLYRAFRRSGWL